MATNYKPEGYQDVIPYLIQPNINGLVKFMKKALDAEELSLMEDEEGNVVHGEMRVGDTVIMMGQSSEQFPQMKTMLHIYVKDVDETFKKAIEAGATVEREVADQFYGDRSGGVKDKWGNQWWFSTHKEDLTEEEMEKRHQEHMKNQQ